MTASGTGSLARRAAGGLAWLAGQSAVAKIISFAAQLVLARLLLKEDFGQYGLAVTVAALTGLLQPSGIRDVLVAKQADFNRLANPGLWMSFGGGVLTAMLMVAAAPLAAGFYRLEDPDRLIRLIWVLALAKPIQSLGMVSAARLSIDMRFRALTGVGVLVAVVDACAKVVLAWLGFGAFSFAVAVVVSACARASMLGYLAPVGFRLRPEFHLWKHLMGDSVLLIAATVCYLFIAQGDYVVLGRMTSPEVVGVYFFAFSLSRQTIAMISSNISRVLLPAYSRIAGQGDRSRRGFIRTSRMIGILVIPVCLAQAAAADPLVRLFFNDRWYGSIPLVQLLSVGMAWRTVSWPVGSYLQSQGRLPALLRLAVASLAIFIPVTVVGTHLGSAIGLAVAVAVFYLCMTAVNLRVALIDRTAWLTCLFECCFLPTALSGIALGAGIGISHVLLGSSESTPVLEASRAGVILGIGGGLYLVQLRWLLPRMWRELVSDLGRIAPARVRSFFAAVGDDKRSGEPDEG